MSRRLDNYLRTYRKRAALSQQEMAFLLGCRDGQVSRYERRLRYPNLKTLLAYEVIFGIPARDLFAGIFEKVEKITTRRAQLLAQKLDKCAPSHLTIHKRARLAA